jgi:hypothetical protein
MLKTFVLALVIPLAVLFASCDGRINRDQQTDILEGAPNFRDLGGYLSEANEVTI